MRRLVKKGSGQLQVVYSDQELPTSYSKSIFLAGPTPRDNNVKSWRPDAIKILEELGYDGIVYVPEDSTGKMKNSYNDQVNWEHTALNKADCILFWIPRDLETMPALTTNVEFGMYYKSGRIVVGSPEEAPKNTYLKALCPNEKINWRSSLEDTCRDAIKFIGDGVQREGIETDIPLLIWNTPSFQQWYKAQIEVGNELRFAKVEYVYKPAPKKDFVFMWIVYVQVYIKSEDRIKGNELVFSRTDLCTAVLYNKKENIEDTEIVLIKEFRSSVSNDECFVYEIPGGSSKTTKENIDVVHDEVSEETGFLIDKSRFIEEGSRQYMSTLSAHKCHLYSVELTEDEMNKIKQDKSVHGVEEDTERTYIEVRTLKDIMSNNLLDWSNIGMILSVINK